MSLTLPAGPLTSIMQSWSLPGRPAGQAEGKFHMQKWLMSLRMELVSQIPVLKKILIWHIQGKKNVLENMVFNSVIPAKRGFEGLVWLKIRHWDTGHSLFVEWISLEQQNVLFDHATPQKLQSSFRDKISNIMVGWQHAFPNAGNLFKIQENTLRGYKKNIEHLV